ncbi:MAG: cytidine deaminase [Prevotellaceae bacterium]|jgi:cytidine deaminase|nr:cytidine deaminase [Prevotellaceae bacterium]
MHIENLNLSVRVSSFDELSDEEKQLVRAAAEACKTSYAPFSGFNVGAALLMASGETVCGSNQENVAFPSGLCAERTAMFYANARYPETPIIALALTSSINGVQNRAPVYPCGSCRQALLQSEIRFGNDITILMAGSESVYTVVGVKTLLPFGFDSFSKVTN